MNNSKPLSQDDLGKGRNERVVHRVDEPSFLTPVTSGSTRRTRIPSARAPHVHLTVRLISLLEEVSGLELSIPQTSNSKTTSLQPMASDVRINRIARGD